VNYAVGKGIRISNNSWGGGGFSSSLFNAINNARAAGHVFIAAAGNGGADGVGDNNDLTPSYPASYNLDNIIAVAATNRNDLLAGFSNYGATSVDLAAPGVSILSTTPNNTYSSFSGTSMATPHVSGVAALLLAQTPTLTYSQIISRILNTVDPVASLAGKVATGGRLNAYNALNTGSPDVTGPRIVSATPNATGPNPVSSVRVTFNEAINPLSFLPADITNFLGPAGTSLTNVAVTEVLGSNGTQFDVSFTPLTVVGAYSFVIGPNISDLAGNLMDQNQDGNKGTASDTYTVQFTITGTSTYTNNTPVAIRDLATVTSTITVPRTLITADLNVRILISHTWDSDLYIYLRGPDGTTVLLVNRRGGSGDNFNNTILTDEAATSIAFGVAPFSGSYRPEQSLSAFDGKNAFGTWTLYIADLAALDVGTLHSWSLTFEESATGASLPSRGQRGGGTRGLAAADFGSEPETTLPTPITPVPTDDSVVSAATSRGENANHPEASEEATSTLFSTFRSRSAKVARFADGWTLEPAPLDWLGGFTGA
jgi:subtilisin-like proprotein convertase family protein